MSDARALPEATKAVVCLLGLAGLVVLYFIIPDPQEVYYQDVVLPDDVSFASSRIWDRSGLQWLVQSGKHVSLEKQLPDRIASRHKFIVLVHGHEAPQSMIASYFTGLIDYYRSVAGDEHHVIVYDWTSVDPFYYRAIGKAESRDQASKLHALCAGSPTCASDIVGRWRLASYGVDRSYAELSGARGLAELLRLLKRDATIAVDIVGHSMGCLVIVEAMKNDPDVFSGVRNIILLAPDVSSDMFDDSALRAALSGVNSLQVFYSGNDHILRALSAVANWRYRLGSSGPTGELPLPANVMTRNVTDTFGTDALVHSRYVTREGAVLMELSNLLR